MFSCNILHFIFDSTKTTRLLALGQLSPHRSFDLACNLIVKYKKRNKMHGDELLKRIRGLLPWLLEVAHSDMYFEENKNWSSLEYMEMIGNFRPAKQDSFQTGRTS